MFADYIHTVTTPKSDVVALCCFQGIAVPRGLRQKVTWSHFSTQQEKRTSLNAANPLFSKTSRVFQKNEVVAPPPFVTHGSSRSVRSRDATKVKCPDGIGRESWVLGRAVAVEG